MKTMCWLAVGSLWLGMQAVCAQDAVAPLRENAVDLFSLNEVRITEGRFKTIQELDHYYLLSL